MRKQAIGNGGQTGNKQRSRQARKQAQLFLYCSHRIFPNMQGDPIRIIPHEIIPDCGSFEVRFADGRKSIYRYWDDDPGRRLRPETFTKAEALRQVHEIARAEREKLPVAASATQTKGSTSTAARSGPGNRV